MTDVASVPRPVGAVGFPRLLPPQPATALADHVRRYGPVPRSAGSLISEVEKAGLRGKGGAAFPSAVKLAAVRQRGRGMVVANGTEGEPASAKDKTLLSLAPHLVLDGAVLAAGAVGATQVIVCVERVASTVRLAVERALAERQRPGFDPVTIRLADTPSRYLAGEESALVHWLNGGEAKPTFTPPRPFERGVGGRPTLVHNVETLAQIALIGRFGGDWFRNAGTPADPGTTLVTLGGVSRPGVYEVAGGAPLAPLFDRAGTSIGQVQALLVGGYFGVWVQGGVAESLDIGQESLRTAGAALGCGAIAALPPGYCGLAESARVARWMASQSAGQCGPCDRGLPAIAGAMEQLVRGDSDGRAEHHLIRWLDMVRGRGACRHPDGTVRFVESALRVFAAEVMTHRRYGACAASRRALLPVPSAGGWR